MRVTDDDDDALWEEVKEEEKLRRRNESEARKADAVRIYYATRDVFLESLEDVYMYNAYIYKAIVYGAYMGGLVRFLSRVV